MKKLDSYSRSPQFNSDRQLIRPESNSQAPSNQTHFPETTIPTDPTTNTMTLNETRIPFDEARISLANGNGLHVDRELAQKTRQKIDDMFKSVYAKKNTALTTPADTPAPTPENLVEIHTINPSTMDPNNQSPQSTTTIERPPEVVTEPAPGAPKISKEEFIEQITQKMHGRINGNRAAHVQEVLENVERQTSNVSTFENLRVTANVGLRLARYGFHNHPWLMFGGLFLTGFLTFMMVRRVGTGSNVNRNQIEPANTNTTTINITQGEQTQPILRKEPNPNGNNSFWQGFAVGSLVNTALFTFKVAVRLIFRR
jgi:hypothetical protein